MKKRWRAEDVLTHPWIVTHANTQPVANYDEHRKQALDELKAKAKAYAAEPFASR